MAARIMLTEALQKLTIEGDTQDKAAVAQIDDTRAQLLIDQGRLNEAEIVARSAAMRLTRAGTPDGA